MTAKNPWTVLSRATVYENRWIRVDHHEVLTPRATPGIYGTIHFKAHAVGVVPVFEDGTTLLVGQHRFPFDAYSWEIPEGGAHEDDLQAACARELAEETGFSARRWEKILEMDLSNSTTDERATAFLAWDLVPGEAAPEETEEIAVRRVPFWDSVAMVERGEIRDAISCAALLRVAGMAWSRRLPGPLSAVLAPER